MVVIRKDKYYRNIKSFAFYIQYIYSDLSGFIRTYQSRAIICIEGVKNGTQRKPDSYSNK